MERHSTQDSIFWTKNGELYRSHDLPSSYGIYYQPYVINFVNRKINGKYFVINPKGTRAYFIGSSVVGVWYDGSKINRQRK